jgi:hypothetical protein
MISVVAFGDKRFGTGVGVSSDSSAALDDEYAAKPTVISDTTDTRILKFTLDPCFPTERMRPVRLGSGSQM